MSSETIVRCEVNNIIDDINYRKLNAVEIHIGEFAMTLYVLQGAV